MLSAAFLHNCRFLGRIAAFWAQTAAFWAGLPLFGQAFLYTLEIFYIDWFFLSKILKNKAERKFIFFVRLWKNDALLFCCFS